MRPRSSAIADDDATRPPITTAKYVPEPGIERVILIPSLVIRPDRHVFDHLQLKII